MALTTAMAILGASALGAGASLASSKSATKAAANASQQATDAAADVNNRALDLAQQNTAVSRAVGNSALASLATRYGLKVPGVTDQGSASQGSGPQFSYQAYLDANPDVAQAAAAEAAKVGDVDGNGSVDPLDYAAWHYEHYGKAEGRDLPLAPVAPPPAQAITNAPQNQVNDQGFYQPPRPTVDAAPTYQAPQLGASSPYQAAPVASGQPYQAPQIAQGAAYQAPQLTGAPGYQAPGLQGETPTYAAPAYRETQIAPLDVSLGAYQQSPDYLFQQEEGTKNILAHAGAFTGINSGATLKALQKFGQDLALGDFNQWRDYQTGQYNTNRADTRSADAAYNAAQLSNAQFGANLGNNVYQYQNTYNQNNAQFGANLANSQWQYGNTYNQNNAQFGANLAENQRQSNNALAVNNAQFGANMAENQRQSNNALNQNNAQFGANLANQQWQYSNNFNANNALNSYNAANTAYQYGTSLAQNAYNSDRDYATGQANANTNALLALSGQGANSTNSYNNAIGANANALSNAFLSNASVQGNAALAGAGQTNNLIGNGLNALAYYYGNGSGAGSNALSYGSMGHP